MVRRKTSTRSSHVSTDCRFLSALLARTSDETGHKERENASDVT